MVPSVLSFLHASSACGRKRGPEMRLSLRLEKHDPGDQHGRQQSARHGHHRDRRSVTLVLVADGARARGGLWISGRVDNHTVVFLIVVFATALVQGLAICRSIIIIIIL